MNTASLTPLGATWCTCSFWHYLHAACMLLDVDMGNVDRVRLVALYAQTSAPHDVVACELGPETMMDTADLYRDLADLYEGCKTMGYWPVQSAKDCRSPELLHKTQEVRGHHACIHHHYCPSGSAT